MAKSSTDRCFEAASLAVVDGIHLCLLPPGCGGVVAGGGDDRTIAVPALPLTRVREALGGEHAPFAHLGGDDADASADDSRRDGEGVPDLMSFVETIAVRPSDLSRAGYRFVHSTSLVEGASKRSLRVFRAHDMEEASMTPADDGHVEVCLPSFASDFESAGDDDGLIFGDDDSTNGPGQSDAFGGDAPVCEVQGAGCCIVVDLLGMAGYEQALVAPRIKANLLSAAWEGGPDDEDAVQQRKQLLQTIIKSSCVMDSAGLVRSKHLLAHGAAVERVGETFRFTMQPVEEQNVGDRDATTMSPETQPSSSGMLTQEEVEMQSSEQSDIPTKEGTDNEKMPPPAWLKAIAETVSGRIAKEAAKAEQRKKSAVAQAELVRRGRKALHEASRCNFNTAPKSIGSGGYFDPEVCRLRYGTRPRTSLETSGGMSLVMDLEIDVYAPGDGKSQASSADTGVFHEFHLSCALANKHQSTGDKSSAMRPSKIRTISGVVPTLKSGDCVTILASILLSELRTSLRDGDDTSTLDIIIQGLWADASSDAQRVASNPTQQMSRRGTVLCILRLPVDALLATPPITTPPCSGHWIQQEIDFASVGDDSTPAPSAIFEYRQPRTLVIDTSGDTQHDIAIWKQLVTNLNSIVGWTSFIDLYCKKGDPRLKLVVFGSNPEDRAATVKLVLKSLPQSAKLVLEEDPDERQRVKALLMSLKNEADAMKEHRALRTEIRPESLAEIGTLQMHTDGVASTIKRGWV